MNGITARKFLLNSVNDITKNFNTAIKLSIPYFILMAVSFAIGFVNGLENEGRKLEAGQVPFSRYTMIIILIAAAIITSSLAISWHRFVLLGEFSREILCRRTFSYLLNGFLVFIIAAVPCVVGFVLFNTFGAVGFIALFLSFFALYILFFRLSLRLPSIAIDNKISFSDSFKKTTGSSWFIVRQGQVFVLLGIAMGVVAFIFSFITMLLFGNGVVVLVVSLLINIAINWLSTLLGISVLTNFYKCYMQGQNN